MAAFVMRRILSSVIVLFGVSLACFALILAVPGDPAVTLAGEGASTEQIASIRKSLGLDRPVTEQYLDWSVAAAQGDLGRSLFSGQSVREIIASGLPASLSLTGIALVVTVTISFPLGIAAARHKGSTLDRFLTLISSVGVAIPSFWLGILLVLVVSHNAGWLPAVGYVPLTENPGEWLRHIILPGFTLGMLGAAEATRQLRSSMIAVLEMEYIRAAYARGLPERRVIAFHALRNAVGPALTVIGIQVAFLLGGSVIVEQVFGINGVGTHAVRAVFERDIPVIQGTVLLAACAVVFVNIMVDCAQALVNPKVMVGG